ncbi:MAG: hypothetical protein QXH92_04580 [Candidatus Aenigmatarchaeota archaeon]
MRRGKYDSEKGKRKKGLEFIVFILIRITKESRNTSNTHLTGSLFRQVRVTK